MPLPAAFFCPRQGLAVQWSRAAQLLLAECPFMDFRNSKLIVTLAILFAVIISTLAYLAFRNAGRDLLERGGMTDLVDQRYPQYDRRYVQASHRDATREEIRTLRKLRDLVHTKDELITTRTEQLREATYELIQLKRDLQALQRRHEALQRETDQTINAFVELSSQVEDDGAQTTPVVREEPRQEDEVSDLDMEVDLIQWQIEQANLRVAELELTALRELVRSSEATQALVATGAAAVPALLDRLEDDDPDVRQWAADVLGQIGPEASLAEEALLEALNDENADVRDAARIALDLIENRS